MSTLPLAPTEGRKIKLLSNCDPNIDRITL
uniref:Uncharacterized protein n=1 Tax=Arundo donax TaxID=35708 RepID=A0A0A8YH34_ARUDO